MGNHLRSLQHHVECLYTRSHLYSRSQLKTSNLPRSLSSVYATLHRHASTSSSSNRWQARQSKDVYTREARVAGLKSRAAFKLLQINDRFRIFKPGLTVVDLGFAPGAWSQVAANRCAPGGRIIGVDILPATPPKGVSTIQGDFLSSEIQEEVRNFVQEPSRGRYKQRLFSDDSENETLLNTDRDLVEQLGTMDLESQNYDRYTQQPATDTQEVYTDEEQRNRSTTLRERDRNAGRVVDVVLSDMSEPWEPTSGFSKQSLINPYRRMMNTSGMPFRDHAGSMDLCMAALEFCFDTLSTGGHFVCKFYQGAEDKILEGRIRKLFEKVSREKPEASRSESREGYFVALKRKEAPTKEQIFAG